MAELELFKLRKGLVVCAVATVAGSKQQSNAETVEDLEQRGMMKIEAISLITGRTTNTLSQCSLAKRAIYLTGLVAATARPSF